MCGIIGFLSFSNNFKEQDLKRMNDCIAHRGPDADGYFYDGTVGLGHRRLSILDLSEAANQPLYSSCGKYVIIYNGEVYNFKEVAAKLNKKMRTTSDTEVILEAFIQFGPDFVQLLNGMFAIAIYNIEKQELFLCRDRLGIKPIFLYKDKDNIVFGSELKSFLKLDYIKSKLTLNKGATRDFLYLGYIPRPNTIYNEIYKMESGSYLIMNKLGINQKTYWNLEDKVLPSVLSDFSSAKRQLKELVLSAVEYRMISDVPFGTFLSGGIDSSLVTAAAQHISSQPINTFSIGFDDPKFNESHFAEAVSKHLKTHHHTFRVNYKDAIDQVEKLTDIYDEPFADSSAIPTLLVSRLARQNVTMTLSGDGGDELFLGYGMYNWAKRLNNPVLKTFRRPLSYLLKNMGNRYERASYLLDYQTEKRLKSHIFSQEQYMFSEVELDKMLTPHFRGGLALGEDFNSLGRNLSNVEEQALFDIKYYLQDDLLVKVDRATMQHSLETRVPLLDYRIVEFALNLSQDLKLHEGISKYILKEVLYDFVPAEIFNRPKWGFSIPLGKWLREDLKFLIDDYLNEKVVSELGVVDYEYVERLLQQFLKGKDFLYNRIWLLIVLHRWLLKYHPQIN